MWLSQFFFLFPFFSSCRVSLFCLYCPSGMQYLDIVLCMSLGRGSYSLLCTTLVYPSDCIMPGRSALAQQTSSLFEPA
ncbi:hypothetical protein F4821DRAFT_121992 [Hypoxylon rubiginosum]|uniref:Uncharacterized protein n=1 Tax=Hypoxylon rubiginosum TaxID=110542 RepID=A0ACC0D250_9PEZI|nr:hypothetical protein F4821DRAFT_121992 [Hypoxylon rubiginosum]